MRASFQPTVSWGLGSWVVGRKRRRGVKRFLWEHVWEARKVGLELFLVLKENEGAGRGQQSSGIMAPGSQGDLSTPG